ncbi:lipopolysaccharide biosynthesis protein [Bacillus sp. II_CA]|uniref:lipopolysaccharide biosynthesis protein n=1 Tax=Bacillus sp. II_CA TaxID=3417451 RepID=UPI003CE87CD8
MRIKKVLEKRFKKDLSNIFILLGGNVAGQAIIFLSSFLITRFYTPEDFGAASIYTAILSIVLVVASWRYEMAIPIAKNKEDSIHLVVLCCLITLVNTIIIIILLALGGSLLELDALRNVKAYLWLIPFSLIGMSIYQILSYWAIRNEMFSKIAKTKLNQSIGQVSLYISLGYALNGPLGLILGDIFGKILGIRILINTKLVSIVRRIRTIKKDDLKRVAYRFKDFPLISSWSAIINTIGLQIPSILIANLYSSTIVGWYMLGQKIILVPFGMLGQAVAQVYISKLTNYFREQPEKCYPLFKNIVVKLCLVGSVPCLLLFLFGESIFSILFGPDWAEAGRYVQILTPMFFLYFVSFPLSQTLSILEYQRLQLIWDILRLVMVFIVFYMAHMKHMNVIHMLTLYSITTTGCYFILLLIVYIVLKRIPMKFKENVDAS